MKELELIELSLDLAAKKRPPAPEPESMIPVADYLDPERFERERTRFFRAGLNLVAHRSEIEDSGHYLALDVVGSPVLLVRDPDGRARAFLNVCRHRGARLVSNGKGSCRRFVCPYHAWTYRTDGRLEHVRHREGFPSLAEAQVSLTELPCVERGSFIFVCPEPRRTVALDPGAAAFVDEIEALVEGEGLALYARESQVRAANWKLLVEGGIESYHFKIAHRSTIAPLFTDTLSTYEARDGHLRSVLPRASITGLRDQPPEARHLLPHANVLYTLNPNAAVLVQDGHFGVVSLTPQTIDQTRIDLWTVGRPVPEGERGAKVRSFLDANHRFTVETLGEDFAMAEQIQGGLASGANEVLRFARFEGALRVWHRTLEDSTLASL